MNARERPASIQPSGGLGSLTRASTSACWCPCSTRSGTIRETVAAMQAQRFDGHVRAAVRRRAAPRTARARSCSSSRRAIRGSACSTIPAGEPRAGSTSACARRAASSWRGWTLTPTTPSAIWRPASSGCARGDTEWVSGPAVPRPSRAGLAGRRAGARVLARARRLAQVGRRPRRRRGARARHGRVRRRLAARAVLEAGGWDERWPINQDSEMASRFLPTGRDWSACPRWPATTCRATRSRARAPVLPLRLLPRTHLPAPSAEHAPLSSDRARAGAHAARRGDCARRAAASGTPRPDLVRVRPFPGAMLAWWRPRQHLSPSSAAWFSPSSR